MNTYLPVAVDFDGTLAVALWTPQNPTTAIGAPIHRNMVKVRELHRAGWEIWIHTARPARDEPRISAWLIEHGVPFNKIITEKPLCALYVDDRARHESEASWLPAKDALSTALGDGNRSPMALQSNAPARPL